MDRLQGPLLARRLRWYHYGLFGVLLLTLLLSSYSSSGQRLTPQVKAQTYRVLVFSKTTGFRHDAIAVGTQAIRDLGAANGFAVTATEDATQFNDANLAQYAAVIFLLTTGDVLDATQQAAFERYIRSGKGYVGVHSASDTEYDWAWYGNLVGAYFSGHPAIQQLTVRIEDSTHPSTTGIPTSWVRTDEPYNFRTNPRSIAKVLANYDESTYSGGTMGGDHPITWCRNYDGGRSWYTGMGHPQAAYSEAHFRTHLLGGIKWAAGQAAGNCGGSSSTVTPVPPSSTPTAGCTTNVARGRPVTVSSSENAGTTGTNAVDGNTGTRWSSAFSDPQWITVDLGATTYVCRVVLRWEAAYARAYQVQLSSDNVTWTTLYSTTTGDGGVDDLSVSGSGRYLRVYMTQRATGYGYSLWELEVYTGSVTQPTATRTRTNTTGGTTPVVTATNTTPPSATRPPTSPVPPSATSTRTNTTQPVGCGTANIAQGKPATASTNLQPAANAVDGNTGTRWESNHGVDQQWIRIDLGSIQSICRVNILWETAAARDYQVQISNDGATFTTIRTVTGNTTTTNDLTGLAASGRYVRIFGTARTTQYGYSIWELRVYAGSGPATITATRTSTSTVGTGPSLTPTRTNTTGVATSTPLPGTNVQLSYNKPASASTIQDNANCVGCTADKAFDNNSATRWASEWADPQWLQVDLGANATINRVRLEWEAAFGRAYQVQVGGSATGPWTTIYSTTTGDGGLDDLSGLNGSGRFVRLNMTTRGTSWGYSLYEFQVFGSGGAPNPTPIPPPTATPHSRNYTLIWSDEFNGAANTFPDSTKWQIEVNANPPNNEAQNYTARTQNVRLNGAGQLILEARKEALGGKQYTSGRINSNGRFTTTYGKIEASIKLPAGTGLWPAFWMLGNDIGTVGWPACGELDIMEFRGRLPRQSSSAIHGPNYSGNTPFFHNYDLPAGATSFVDGYHLFSLEWEPTQLRFYVDGNLHYTVNKSQIEVYGRWVFDHPHFIILNLAVGGVFDGNQLPPDSALPAQVLVDYVRVYQ